MESSKWRFLDKALRSTLTNPNAEGRETQYFEVSGHRAIYHDGWKAFTSHKKGEPFENDQWFLYHVEEDFSETNNLAEQYPKKLSRTSKVVV